MARLATSIGFAFGICALTASVTAPARAADLKVGTIYSVSGPLAGLGAMFQNGVGFVVDRYNTDYPRA